MSNHQTVNKGMSPLEYLEKVGRREADATAERAQLSPAYFNQICYGHRRASVDAATRLVKHQDRRGRMTLLSILLHKVPRSKNGAVVRRRKGSGAQAARA